MADVCRGISKIVVNSSEAQTKFNLTTFNVFSFTYVSVLKTWGLLPQCKSGDQRATWGSLSFHHVDPVIKLRTPGLAATLTNPAISLAHNSLLGFGFVCFAFVFL